MKNYKDIQWHFTRMHNISQNSTIVLITYQSICDSDSCLFANADVVEREFSDVKLRDLELATFLDEEMILNWTNIPVVVENFATKYLDCAKKLTKQSDCYSSIGRSKKASQNLILQKCEQIAERLICVSLIS